MIPKSSKALTNVFFILGFVTILSAPKSLFILYLLCGIFLKSATSSPVKFLNSLPNAANILYAPIFPSSPFILSIAKSLFIGLVFGKVDKTSVTKLGWVADADKPKLTTSPSLYSCSDPILDWPLDMSVLIPTKFSKPCSKPTLKKVSKALSSSFSSKYSDEPLVMFISLVLTSAALSISSFSWGLISELILKSFKDLFTIPKYSEPNLTLLLESIKFCFFLALASALAAAACLFIISDTFFPILLIAAA